MCRLSACKGVPIKTREGFFNFNHGHDLPLAECFLKRKEVQNFSIYLQI